MGRMDELATVFGAVFGADAVAVDGEAVEVTVGPDRVRVVVAGDGYRVGRVDLVAVTLGVVAGRGEVFAWVDCSDLAAAVVFVVDVIRGGAVPLDARPALGWWRAVGATW